MYDPTGELLRTPQQRSADWVSRVETSARATGAAAPTWLRPLNKDNDFFPRYVHIESYGQGLYLVTETWGWFL